MAEIIETPQDNIILDNVSQDQIIDDTSSDNIVLGDAQLIRQIYTGENTDSIEIDVDNTTRTISADLVQNQYASKLEFPNVGSNKLIYVDLSDNSLWRFDETSLTYVCVGRDYEDIAIINGGNA